MTRFKTFGLVSLMLLVVGVMTAASASATNALPDAFVLSGEAYPISLSGEGRALAATEAERETEFALITEASKLPALAVKSTITFAELSALGKVKFIFTGVHEKRAAAATCTRSGDATGEVAFEGEFHLVFNLYTPTLELAMLILFAPFEFECTSGLKVKVSGQALLGVAPLAPATGSEDITNVNVFSHCFKGVQGTAEILSYFSDTEELKNVLFKSNLGGAENEKSCQEVRDTVLLGISAGTATMFSILH
jgi:hypothetical protein